MKRTKFEVEEFSGCFIVFGPTGPKTGKEFCGEGYQSDKARAEKYAKEQNARLGRL